MAQNRRIHQEVLHRGRIIELHRVRVRMPGGAEVDRDLIHHRGAAVILPVLEDGRIALIRNYRYALDDTLYELPAGTLEAGEDPLDCARRELTEETGYTGRRFELLSRFALAPGTSDEIIHAYLATDLAKGRQELELHEEIEVEVFEPARVRDMLQDGTIRDAKTMAILCLYWLRKGGL